ncbi:MAG: HupE/UreJ family protein [Gammaproteobacteria bacterium]
MHKMHSFECSLAIAALTAAPAAGAHTLAAEGAPFLTGFAHPLLGVDHLLAMLAVGLWAAQLGGRALWYLPLAFASVVMAGVALGAEGVALPMVQAGIASSVLVLGLALAFVARLPAMASLALVGLFAVSHGHAHGSELVHAAFALSDSLGFLLATVTVLLAGLHLGGRFRRALAARTVPLSRLSGAVIAASGLLLWA